MSLLMIWQGMQGTLREVISAGWDGDLLRAGSPAGDVDRLGPWAEASGVRVTRGKPCTGLTPTP